MATGPEQRLALDSAEKSLADLVDGLVPTDNNGKPLILISCAAAELVPTKQYGNVTVGPIVVKRWITDGDDDHVLSQIHNTQRLCERAVAEDRETVHNMIRQSEQGRV